MIIFIIYLTGVIVLIVGGSDRIYPARNVMLHIFGIKKVNMRLKFV